MYRNPKRYGYGRLGCTLCHIRANGSISFEGESTDPVNQRAVVWKVLQHGIPKHNGLGILSSEESRRVVFLIGWDDVRVLSVPRRQGRG
jgi:hypothetical protein